MISCNFLSRYNTWGEGGWLALAICVHYLVLCPQWAVIMSNCQAKCSQILLCRFLPVIERTPHRETVSLRPVSKGLFCKKQSPAAINLPKYIICSVAVYFPCSISLNKTFRVKSFYSSMNLQPNIPGATIIVVYCELNLIMFPMCTSLYKVCTLTYTVVAFWRV